MSQFKILLKRVKNGEQIPQEEICIAMDKMDVFATEYIYEDALLQLVYFAGMVEASNEINKVE